VSEFIGTNGKPMVPLRCQSCGEQIGLRDAGTEPDPTVVVARCYACAAVEEAGTNPLGATVNLFRKVTAVVIALLAAIVILPALPLILLFSLLANLSEVVMP
jgi:hypothetical protein